MSTVTTRRNAGVKAESSLQLADKSALIGLMERYTSYGGSDPLYKILSNVGVARPINTLDDAFESFDATRAGLKDLQVGFSYSSKYDGYSCAIKTGDRILYASIQHDKDGNPLELPEYKLCEVEVTRDFFIPERPEAILKKGDRFLKMLDPEYKGA